MSTEASPITTKTSSTAIIFTLISIAALITGGMIYDDTFTINWFYFVITGFIVVTTLFGGTDGLTMPLIVIFLLCGAVMFLIIVQNDKVKCSDTTPVASTTSIQQRLPMEADLVSAQINAQIQARINEREEERKYENNRFATLQLTDAVGIHGPTYNL